MLADVLSRAMPLAERLARRGRKKNPELSQVTPEDITLLEKLQNWRLARGGDAMAPIFAKLAESQLPLFLSLLFVGISHRGVEDVEGMTGLHMQSAVAIAARNVYLDLARARAAKDGMIRFSDAGVCVWQSEHRQLDMAGFLRGAFPGAEGVDEHIVWLRDQEREFVEEASAHWLTRFFLRWSARWIESDLRPTTQRSVPDHAYRPRNAPTGRGDVEAALAAYATSVDDLLAMIPRSDDASVRIAGSVAEGWNHARSDIDLVVLTDSVPVLPFRAVSGVAGHIECKCGVTPAGHNVWIEYMAEPFRSALQSWQLENSQAMGAPESMWAAHRLRALWASPMARSFHRAILSVALREGAAQARWSTSLSIEDYTGSVVLSHFLRYRAGRSEAAAHASTHALAALAAARTAYEHLLLALLASRSRFLWHRKWIPVALVTIGERAGFCRGRGGCDRRRFRPAHAPDGEDAVKTPRPEDRDVIVAVFRVLTSGDSQF